MARLLVADPARPGAEPGFARLLADAVLHAPVFTLRGGTNEVLRGVVARGRAALMKSRDRAGRVGEGSRVEDGSVDGRRGSDDAAPVKEPRS